MKPLPSNVLNTIATLYLRGQAMDPCWVGILHRAHSFRLHASSKHGIRLLAT
jgi:hypothetical protein